MFSLGKALLTSLLLSAFIYFDYFGITNTLVNTIVALGGFYLLLTISKKELFLSGFFIAILWFWWIGYSFIYYDLTYLIPIVLIVIGCIYGVLFYFAGVINHIYYRAIYLVFLSYIYPFGFDWLQIELPFINSFIGTSKIDFSLMILSLTALIQLPKYYKIFAIIPLIFTIELNTNIIQNPDINIYLAHTNIDQDKKWDRKYTKDIVSSNLKLINQAIKTKKELIVLPETAFPLILNKHIDIINILKEKSLHISIIVGSLYKQDDNFHNSTYFFEDGKMKVAHKVVLIPFGEAIPLPQLLKDMINNTFYDGAKDYEPSKNPTDFNIKGILFRNAICYEATTNKIFQNLKTQYMIVISNNAWFTPSIQPTLQNLLLKYYARKYQVKIFSCTNKGINSIIN